RPELTAERFVPDPFAAEPGARMYRTGDRARWLAEGELEYLGRIDQQVKVRGFRIEPGEVEAVLRAHPAVGEAVVAARPDGSDGVRLVAYHLAAEGAARPEAEELRTWLRERLPEYMVPSAFVALEALPLTPSGKLDRRALPEPAAEAAAASDFAPPSTPAEEILAGIWSAVLGTERVGAHDDFFALGGHSLLATQVASRVRQAFGMELPLRALFEAPTVARLAVRVEALRSEGAAAAPPIGRASREEALPLSFGQQRLWVVDRLEPGSAAYNMAGALRLRGALDAAALRAALGELARRHETLRTTFADRGGVPVQVIHPAAPVPLPLLDLRALPAGAREAEAERLAGAEALRPFDLARGPLLRCSLLRLDRDDHVLCLTLHHAVGDGWSVDVLAGELSALYAAFVRGVEPRLPDLPIQYADFAVWQREWLRGDLLDAQTGFWRERLAGAPPLLELPTDRPRAAGQSPRAGSHRFTLPADVSRGLRRLAREEGATLFMTLLAGWQALLGRYAGQDDVVVGSPVAGRTRVETEGLIGFFVNVLALRADLAGDPTWRELLGRTREAALGAYAHQDLPFERLVDELDVERSLAHTPLFQVVFALQRAGGLAGRLSLDGVEPASFGGEDGVVRFDMSLTVDDDAEALAGTLVYRAALFDAATAARMAGHLAILLEAMAAEPARRIAGVPLLRGAEREQVLEAWNATAADRPRACVHALFAEQAARTPDAPAVVFGEDALTYGELERRANQLAHALRRRGVGPEVRVGLCLERGVAQVVAVLAAWKAGGAYVPLDPAAPARRQEALLDASGAPVLLTQAHLAGRFGGYAGAVLRLDADRDEIERESVEAPQDEAVPANLAYVIYTSGSTGTPRGVLVQHASVVNLAAALGEAVYSRRGGGAAPRVSVNGPLTFDTSVKQLVQLLHGATLCIVPEEVRLDARLLGAYLRRHSVEVLDCTPAQLRQLLADGLLDEAGPALTDLLVAGEAMDAGLWEALGALPGRRAWNLYGPTECTVDASLRRVDGARPTIGRAVANARLYVLDADGEPVLAGVVGELYVGGAGVARGYQGHPDLTAGRFVPDAFGGPGERLYRTGDRVRWTGAGELEYVGRTDHQVKVRGFRVEPGEIEAALAGLPGVREAVVAVREDAPGQKRLVAYVVPEPGTGVSGAELREQLAARLPEHMVPGAFVALASVPLTPNGKTDRAALPAPERTPEGDAHVAPRTEAERVLCEVWAGLLGVDRVGVEDSFFELGGDSILAIQVVSRARQRGLKLAPRQLFEHPTIARLAAVAEAAADGSAAAPQGAVTGEVPLTPIQRRFFAQDRPARHHYNQALLLAPREALDPALLARAAAALEAHHDALRLRFRRDADGA
ncbi:MAG: amino acid adenylation domain-containing protein, partial [Longimicrobiaceae bacterium]